MAKGDMMQDCFIGQIVRSIGFTKMNNDNK